MKKLFVCIVSLIIFFASCQRAKPHIYKPPVFLDGSYASTCPFLTKDHKGNIVISWIREINDSDAIMCYSVMDKNGSWSQIHEIIPSRGVYPHAENLPKIAFKSDGTVVAMWGIANPNPKNKYSGLVVYAFSKNGKDWSPAMPLVHDPDSYDQRYFDLKVLSDGRIAAVWLDSRMKNNEDGSTMFFAETDTGNRFVNEKPIAKTCCPCCRTALFIDKNGALHAIFREIIQDSIRDMVHMVSTDKGRTFSRPVRIAADNWVINGCPHTGPAMTANNKGLHFAWYTLGNGSGIFYCNSMDNGKHFSPKEAVSTNSSAKHPQIATVGNDIAIVWDENNNRDKMHSSHIGLQIRSETGQAVSRQFVTPDSLSATFPVIIQGHKHLVIAYTTRQNERTKVAYQSVRLD